MNQSNARRGPVRGHVSCPSCAAPSRPCRRRVRYPVRARKSRRRWCCRRWDRRARATSKVWPVEPWPVAPHGPLIDREKLDTPVGRRSIWGRPMPSCWRTGVHRPILVRGRSDLRDARDLDLRTFVREESGWRGRPRQLLPRFFAGHAAIFVLGAPGALVAPVLVLVHHHLPVPCRRRLALPLAWDREATGRRACRSAGARPWLEDPQSGTRTPDRWSKLPARRVSPGPIPRFRQWKAQAQAR